MTRPLTPADTMILGAVRCVRCGASYGQCDCWQKCSCGRSHAKGAACSNPIHGCEKAAEDAADVIARNVVAEMRTFYPEPMRYASGGFAKTLKGRIRREAYLMVLEILTTPPDTTPPEAA